MIIDITANLKVSDDKASEENAINNAKEIIRETNRQVIELSTAKFSLQSASTVLEVRTHVLTYSVIQIF